MDEIYIAVSNAKDTGRSWMEFSKVFLNGRELGCKRPSGLTLLDHGHRQVP